MWFQPHMTISAASTKEDILKNFIQKKFRFGMTEGLWIHLFLLVKYPFKSIALWQSEPTYNYYTMGIPKLEDLS